MYSKSEVGFEHPAKGPNKCGACFHYLGGKCAIVAGVVAPEDWCRKFVSLPMLAKSPAEMASSCNGSCGNCNECNRKAADARSNHPGEGIKEHGLNVTSRTTGKSVEVTFGPQGGGLVPKNPFASLAQAGYMHSHPEVLGKTALDEWDSATKGKKLPKHVKKGN
jgi:hypothetical protein